MVSQSSSTSGFQDTPPMLRGPVFSAWDQVYVDHGRPTRGFINMNNICFRNAVFMLFLHSPILLNWCEDYHSKHSCTNCLPCIFRHTALVYWLDISKKCQHREMTLFWKELHNKRFGSYRWDKTPGNQEDARELMDTVISLLIRDTKQPSVDNLQDLFTMQLNQNAVCRKCGRQDTLPADQGKFLVVDLPNGSRRVTIDDAISNSMKSIYPKKCETCKIQTNHDIQKQVMFSPEMLFIQVNRYKAQGKLLNEVEVQEQLVIPDALIHEAMKTKHKLRYELYGVIFHKGNLQSSGHYTAAVKGPSGQWALVNDLTVTSPLTLAQIMSSPDGGKGDAYILAYRRLPLQGSPTQPVASQTKADTKTGSTAAASPTRPKKASSPGQRSSSSDPGKGPVKGGVQLEETIALDRRDIHWVVKQQLVLPADAGGLVKLKPRTKTQRAVLKLTLTSEETGETLEGQVNISLKPGVKKTRSPSPTKMNTKTSKPGTKKTKPVSGKAAKPQGVKKKASKAKKQTSDGQSPEEPANGPPPRRSTRIRNQSKK